MINDATKLQTSMKIARNKEENMMFLPLGISILRVERRLLVYIARRRVRSNMS